ncbi:MAG: hypothetical protein QG552_2938 [Thermodesulfobacteriota bacterium]|nr:hypothetical protein [Thermodesulfobacteriota bacterium]
MDARAVLGYLEAVAEQLGVEIRYEPMEGETVLSPGGMCRIRGKTVIIVNAKAPLEDQVRTLVKALRRLDLSQIYLRPGIRDLLECDTGDEVGTG